LDPSAQADQKLNRSNEKRKTLWREPGSGQRHNFLGLEDPKRPQCELCEKFVKLKVKKGFNFVLDNLLVNSSCKKLNIMMPTCILPVGNNLKTYFLVAALA
jgi:hypothetical protein